MDFWHNSTNSHYPQELNGQNPKDKKLIISDEILKGER